mmetsp:Transcript_12446/g.21557  ORF Transcript_12446/g.21557 Transcript_12446/m.21557 type:complete len:363 (+) Transcript_12446:101-1189(+)
MAEFASACLNSSEPHRPCAMSDFLQGELPVPFFARLEDEMLRNERFILNWISTQAYSSQFSSSNPCCNASSSRNSPESSDILTVLQYLHSSHLLEKVPRDCSEAFILLKVIHKLNWGPDTLRSLFCSWICKFPLLESLVRSSPLWENVLDGHSAWPSCTCSAVRVSESCSSAGNARRLPRRLPSLRSFARAARSIVVVNEREFMHAIQNCGRAVHAIRISGKMVLERLHFEMLGRSCPNLIQVDIGSEDDPRGSSVTDACVQYLTRRCPKLLKISIFGATSLTNAGFMSIWQNCRFLRTLCLPGTGQVPGSIASDAMHPLLNPLLLPKLRLLDLTDQRVSMAAARNLMKSRSPLRVLAGRSL